MVELARVSFSRPVAVSLKVEMNHACHSEFASQTPSPTGKSYSRRDTRKERLVSLILLRFPEKRLVREYMAFSLVSR